MDKSIRATCGAQLSGLRETTFQAGLLSQMFDKIYVINLKERTDRYREMETQLALVGLSFEHPSVECVRAHQPEDRGAFDSIGARGCFLSHLDVLRRALAAGHHSILILEDDVEWTKKALSLTTQEVQNFRTTPWQFMHGGIGEHCSSDGITPGLKLLPPEEDKLLAHFIGMRGETIGLAKEWLEILLTRPEGASEGGPMHVDGAYSWLRRENPNLKSYICSPGIARQRSSRSDISPPRGWKSNQLVQKLFSCVRYLRWIAQKSGLLRYG